MRPFLALAHRWPWLGLLCLGLLLGFAFQGSRGLWSPDEGRYVDGALQMLDSGNYLVPTYSPDEPNFSKPPLTYWIIAASIKAFGHSPWAVRAPYALAYALTLLTLYAIGKQLIPDKPWLPGLVYACSVFPFVAGNIVSTDAFLTLCEALAMLGFLRTAFGDAAQRKSSTLLMWLGFGLAFLTKGPPGLLPLLAVLPFIVHRDGWRGLGKLFPWAGIAIFLIVGLGWYAIVVLRYAGVLDYFLRQEVYNRLFTGAQHRHAGALGWAAIYLPTLALGMLPWWPGLIRGMRAAGPAACRQRWKNGHSVEFFLLLWFLLPFAVFCLAQSRLPLYLLPLFLPLSLMLALELRQRIDLRKTRQRAWLCAWIAALLILKGGVAYFMHPPIDDRLAARQLGAVAAPDAYATIVFVHGTAASYVIEEETPWGMRFYLGKPVYGIPWLSPHSHAALCHAVRGPRPALVVVDPYLPPEILEPALRDCPVRRIVRVGSWRSRTLELVQQ